MSALLQTDELFFARTGMDPDAVQRIVRDALTGADDGELFLEYSQSEGLVWDDGKLRTASFDTSQGFGVRAIADEAVGFAHAVTLDEATISRAARSVSAVTAGYSGTVAEAPMRTNRALYDDANPLESKPFGEKIALLQDIDAYLRAADSRVQQVSIALSADWQAIQIMRADGWRGADIRPLVHLNISVYAKNGDRMESGSFGAGGRENYTRLFHPSEWKRMADEALRSAFLNLEAVDARAGEMPVVLGPGWPAVILHEAIGHGLEGDFIRKQTSAFTGLKGQRVAAKGITIVDDGTLSGRRGSISIDDEGTPSQCTTLVEDGVLVGCLQDRMNARLMGGQSTGNGRREGFASLPCPRMTNTMMLSGGHDPQEILSTVKNGLYAVNFGGGQVDITSGKFVFSTTEAYEIVDGKIGRPVKGASLVGTGFEVLKHVTMVGNDSKLDQGIGSCGKAGQTVPVGVGQPTMLVDKLTVGGASV